MTGVYRGSEGRPYIQERECIEEEKKEELIALERL